MIGTLSEIDLTRIPKDCKIAGNKLYTNKFQTLNRSKYLRRDHVRSDPAICMLVNFFEQSSFNSLNTSIKSSLYGVNVYAY